LVVRRALMGLVVVLFVVLAGPAVATPSVNGDPWTPVLLAGHCIQTSKNDGLDKLESRSQRFQLVLSRDGQLSLDDQVDFGAAGSAGYTTWDAYIPRPDQLGHRSSLCMTGSGDLVLRKDSQIVWQTGTAGEATGGRARLIDTGHLVVATATGRVVWSSRTTAVLLAHGDRVRSGATLVNRTYPGSTTRLRMDTDGDLVLTRNHDTVWQTDTHARGSELVITAAGRMAIRSPHGTTVWHSPAEGRYTILRIAQGGRIVLGSATHDNRCWVRPVYSTANCGTG
jgi:hypothetical protein